jgi:guanine nucleotide-binding protein G(i) subunit alpha
MGGFTQTEKMEHIDLIKSNLFHTLEALSRGCIRHSLKLTAAFDSAYASLREADFFISQSLEFNKEVCLTLWNNSSVRECLKLYKDDLQILDSALHYLEQIDLIFSKDYVPSDADMLYARAMTFGTVEIDIQMESNIFRMIDVGGQRGQRVYWMHAFDDVNAILFLASLADYNLKLEEDVKKNRLDESFAVFGAVVH